MDGSKDAGLDKLGDIADMLDEARIAAEELRDSHPDAIPSRLVLAVREAAIAMWARYETRKREVYRE